MDNQTYHCRRCTAEYLPYKKNIVCPKCGEPAPDADVQLYEGFVDRLVLAMRENKEKYGQYVPKVMVPDTLAGDVRMLVFEIFDQLEAEKPADKKMRIEEIIAEGNSRNHEYLKDHICAIALETLEQLERSGVLK